MQLISGAGMFSQPEGDAHWVEQLRVPDLSVGTYSIRAGGTDDQSPHTEDEIYAITAGRATLVSGGDSAQVGPGTVVYVPAFEEHRFTEITEDFAALVFFAPAEEARASAASLLAAAEDAMAEAGFRTGDFGRAGELIAAAQAAAAHSGDERAAAHAKDLLGLILHYQNITVLMAGGQLPDADITAEQQAFADALAEWTELGDPSGMARSLFGLGLVQQVLMRDWAAAMPLFWQALDLGYRADLYTRSEVHRHVGFYYSVEAGQPAEAVRHLRLSLEYREALGDPRRIPSGLVALGEAELAAGNPERAVELLREAVVRARAARLLPARIESAEQALAEAEVAAATATAQD
jgi:mannose-6-phosphate isomerase-like protein (cupin superfamily)